MNIYSVICWVVVCIGNLSSSSPMTCSVNLCYSGNSWCGFIEKCFTIFFNLSNIQLWLSLLYPLFSIFEYLLYVRLAGIQHRRKQSRLPPPRKEFMILCNKKVLCKWEGGWLVGWHWVPLLREFVHYHLFFYLFLHEALHPLLSRLPVIPFACVSQLLTFVSSSLALMTRMGALSSHTSDLIS